MTLTSPTGSDSMDMEELDESVKAQLGKTEITLTLTNKFEVPEDDQLDLKSLLIKYVLWFLVFLSPLYMYSVFNLSFLNGITKAILFTGILFYTFFTNNPVNDARE